VIFFIILYDGMGTCVYGRSKFVSAPLADACICLDDVSSFMTTNTVAIVGVALGGKSSVVSAISDMVRSDDYPPPLRKRHSYYLSL
jgi:hypothetical protein